jgi:shikimate dehydrogenase
MKKKFCLIGDSVSHSKSHIIHGELLAAYKVDGSYDLLDVAARDLGAVAARLRQYYDGFNITKPYKEDIIKYIDGLEGSAAECRSVNTVLISCGKATGYSTDGAGFLRSCKKEGVGFDGKSVSVLGAGGVAKAIVRELTGAACDIYVSNHDKKKVLDFVNFFQSPKVRVFDAAQELKYDVVINCTPVGQSPDINEAPVKKADIAGAEFVFDTVYNPEQTLLLSYARELNIKCAGGFDMLFFQAYESERIWQGRGLNEDKIFAALQAVKKRLGG